jgi:hypothetical protein
MRIVVLRSDEGASQEMVQSDWLRKQSEGCGVSRARAGEVISVFFGSEVSRDVMSGFVIPTIPRATLVSAFVPVRQQA